MEFLPYLRNIGIRTLSFWTLEVASYPLTHWNSHLILLGKVIPTFSFSTLEITPCRYKHWNSRLILLNIGFHTLSFQTLEYGPYPSKPLNSHLIFSFIGIRTLSFETLEFALYPLSIGICILSFWQKYWNSHLILSWHVFRSYPLNTGIRHLSFQTVASHPIFSNLGILNLPLQTLELAPYSFQP